MELTTLSQLNGITLLQSPSSPKLLGKNKLLSKAIRQRPTEHPSIIHIEYETQEGSIVEFTRQKRIQEAVCNLDDSSENIQLVFVNAL